MKRVHTFLESFSASFAYNPHMPSSYLATGDFLVIQMPVSGANILTAMAPVPLQASKALDCKFDGRPACLEGDELPPPLRGPQPYMVPGSFMIPGTGTIELILNPSNTSKKSDYKGTPFLLQGTPFQVKFSVSNPAKRPLESGGFLPDPMMVKMGTARFQTTILFAQSD